MKKIKLLLLGIVSILGIGFSYSSDYLYVPSLRITTGSLSANDTILNEEYNHCFDFGLSYNNGVPLYFSYSLDGRNFYQAPELTILCGKFSLRNSFDVDISYNSSYSMFYSGLFSNNSFDSYAYTCTSSDSCYISNSISRRSTGIFELPEGSCAYLPGTIAGLELYSPGFETSLGSYGGYSFFCGDALYLSNTSTSNRNFSYYLFPGLYYGSGYSSDDSGGDDEFTSPVNGGIFDFNTFLIEKAVLCYMSSGTYGGTYGDCMGINYSGFINQYNPSYTTWSGSSIEDYYGQLLFTNAQSVLSNYCVNTDLIQYPFCSQLDLYSGAYLLYFFENGKLDYYILGDGFGVDLGNLGSGQLGELTCTGVWCDFISQGLPEYIYPTNSGNDNNFGLSGDIISEDFYNDFIDKGFWFTCPYSYSQSYFVLGKDLINRLGGRDLMIPVNCFISAFSMGRKMLFFGDPEYGKYWSGSLINGDTPGHQRFFMFFDLVLSLGIIVVLSKLFKLLTTKK